MISKPQANPTTVEKQEPRQSTKNYPRSDKNRPLRTLRDFKYKDIQWYRDNIASFMELLDATNETENQKYLAKMLTWAAELVALSEFNEESFHRALCRYIRRFTLDYEYTTGPTPEQFDDQLYGFAEKAWLSYLDPC